MGQCPPLCHVYGIEISFDDMINLALDRGMYEFLGGEHAPWKFRLRDWDDESKPNKQFPLLHKYCNGFKTNKELYQFCTAVKQNSRTSKKRRFSEMEGNIPVKELVDLVDSHLVKYEIDPDDTKALYKEVYDLFRYDPKNDIFEYTDYYYSKKEDGRIEIPVKKRYSNTPFTVHLYTEECYLCKYILGIGKVVETGYSPLPISHFDEKDVNTFFKNLFPEKTPSYYYIRYEN